MLLTSCLTTLQVEVCKFNYGVSTGHHSLTSYRSVINPRCCDNCTAASPQFEPSSRFTPPTKMENVLDSESDTDTQLDVKKVSRRAQQHLQNVRAALVSWRLKTATRDFPVRPGSASCTFEPIYESSSRFTSLSLLGSV